MRVEDLDQPRTVPGASARILATLRNFGFEWDGEVAYQSDRIELYDQALQDLGARDLLLRCRCSRRQIPEGARYPGTCRELAIPATTPVALRLRVDPGWIEFRDRLQGSFRQDVAAASGDFIVRRKDGIVAYVLAVVVDDAVQGITHIVRGADLLDDTARQISLQRALNLPLPRYAHVPLLTEADGRKLAKSRRSVPVTGLDPVAEVYRILQLLGQNPPPGLDRTSLAGLWDWAIAHWDLAHVPHRLALRLAPAAYPDLP